MNEWFRKFSGLASDATGSWQAFLLAVLIVVVWFAAGFFVGFQNTFYQLLINTGTTIITFLMVFLIQNTQNRDAKALHLKLDELLRAVEGARTSMANLENLPDAELKKLQEEFQRICRTRGFGGSAVETIDDELEERGVSGSVAK
ncbi:MAG: low affinity iron permease family protein [Acidobacteriota bacterium]|nr:low affinity iron permease family protein [Acidobacteriota bacterium]MDQ5838080.1 low affinity iron permease family protein [Acidobacteriota bacterium]